MRKVTPLSLRSHISFYTAPISLLDRESSLEQKRTQLRGSSRRTTTNDREKLDSRSFRSFFRSRNRSSPDMEYRSTNNLRTVLWLSSSFLFIHPPSFLLLFFAFAFIFVSCGVGKGRENINLVISLPYHFPGERCEIEKRTVGLWIRKRHFAKNKSLIRERALGSRKGGGEEDNKTLLPSKESV